MLSVGIDVRLVPKAGNALLAFELSQSKPIRSEVMPPLGALIEVNRTVAQGMLGSIAFKPNRRFSRHGHLNILAALVTGLGALLAHARTSGAQEDPVTAIDIALEPDATMIQHAEAANARLLEVFPKGFRLDATHHPHISMLQRYVRTADLDKVYAAAGKVLADEKVTSWTLKAFKYYYIPSKDIGLGGIVVESTDDLLRLQQELIDAVAPFAEKTGTAAAYVTTPEDPEINQPTIDYVAAFVPEATGKNFNPHVTIGIAPQDYLKEMLAEPFDVFTFSPASASVYQLGNFGTARKELKAWDLKP